MKEKIVYALGYFDGVHLGHASLLAACRGQAEALGCGCGVVTFTGHPEQLLTGATPPLINTDRDRNMLLGQHHMDRIVELPFDRTLMRTPWRDFLDQLVERHGAAGFVCGTDFRFGNKGEGTARDLQSYCREHGLACCLVEQQLLDTVRISSSYIRILLEKGEISRANRFLGHPHVLTGQVISGRRLGRTIGVPTANFAYPPQLVCLPHGVYACRVWVDGKAYTAVTNVGTRPTVAGEGVTVESWLQDFDGDLYGRQICVEFYGWIRAERAFADLHALQGQIREDLQQVQDLFMKEKPGENV